MRIKLKYPDIDTFVQKYAVNISRGGIFIATKQPKPIGTYVRFEFLLSDAGQSSIIRGEGQVQWTKDFDPANPGKPHGMGVKFMRLDAESQAVVDRALKWRAEHGTSPSVALPAAGSAPNALPTREQSQTARLPGRDAPTERLNARESATIAAAATTAAGDDTARMSADEAAAALERGAADEAAPDAPVDERTERVTLPEATAAMASAREAEGPREELPDVRPLPPGTRQTRPIAIEEPGRRGPYEATRPITLPEARNRPLDEIDSLAVEWGLSEEKVARVLKRARPRMVEATAELERLLLKPPKLATPTKAEALAQLGSLLAKKPRSNP
jgi:uncharacterized protein (TIGR02266 family)